MAFSQTLSLGRSQFVRPAYPTSLTPTDFVNQLFTENRVTKATADQLHDAINEFGPENHDHHGHGSARKSFAPHRREPHPGNDAEKNKAFVLMQYLGYLRRDPNTGPDSDYTGYDFWLQKLNNHGGDFHAAQMVRSFIVSGEYLNRF